MIVFLQNRIGTNVPADNTAKVDLKRGHIVSVSDANKELDLATNDAGAYGFVTRDVVVNDDVALGLPVSNWDLDQDTVKAGEYAGVRIFLAGEQYATDVHGTLTDAQAEAGSNLKVEKGVLVTSTSASKFVSLGWTMVARHKMLGFRLA